jgi:hypothetical protein
MVFISSRYLTISVGLLYIRSFLVYISPVMLEANLSNKKSTLLLNFNYAGVCCKLCPAAERYVCETLGLYTKGEHG